MINLSILQGDDKIFIRRLFDLQESVAVRNKPRFTSFLSDGERILGQEFVEQRHVGNILFHGGFPEAQRVILGFFPDYMQPQMSDFPLEAILLRHGKDKKLGHRDVLGSLIGLGIRRDSIGDILPDYGVCHVILLAAIIPTVVADFSRIGRTGVRCETANLDDLTPKLSFREIKGTVSSYRLDCIVSLLCNLSREKSSALIQSELVRQNDCLVRRTSASFLAGDIITVRGHGKFRVDEIGLPTRKGRLPVRCVKYE